MPDVRELVIVGSGPAGLTAALYAARANLEPVVIEGLEAGGQLMLTSDVENYPGFPDGILGPELMTKFREQAGRFGAEFVTADADRVDLSSSPFGAWVGDKEYRSHALIVSTGASARMLGWSRRARSSATASPPARPATASSSGRRRSRSSVVAIRPSRRPSSSPGSRPR
jgi:thioredoxin reductase